MNPGVELILGAAMGAALYGWLRGDRVSAVALRVAVTAIFFSAIAFYRYA